MEENPDGTWKTYHLNLLERQLKHVLNLQETSTSKLDLVSWKILDLIEFS
jgi:hypothetical protein